MYIDGTFRVLGTSSDPIYFTSLRDDTIGGDTNGDGGGSTPGRGNWRRIEFRDSSDDANSLIEYAEIRYGGDDVYAGPNYGAITLIDASPTVQNSTIVESEAYGIRTRDSSPNLVCNDIYDNGSYGLFNESIATVVDAQDQWWGSQSGQSGPYHSTLNPDGTGDRVSDGVDFVPWRTSPCGSMRFMVFMPVALR
jgi:hypothetical protein